jgi:xanthine dehydrogenase small subunit
MVNESYSEELKNVSPIALTKVFQPGQLSDAWALKENYGAEAAFIAGGTLFQLQREQGTPFPPFLISLEKLQELKGITTDEGSSSIRIGALTTIADLRTNPIISSELELLSIAAKEIGSPAVRNRGTIGGNVGYGTGDLLPALLTLDAELTLYDGIRFHRVFLWDYLNKSFGSGSYMMVVSVSLPKRTLLGSVKDFYLKIGRREAFVPSLVTVSGACVLGAGKMIEHIRLVAAGGASVPQRLIESERKLKGNPLKEPLLIDIHEMILKEYRVVPDAFASENYRKITAANVIISELETMMD